MKKPVSIVYVVIAVAALLSCATTGGGDGVVGERRVSLKRGQHRSGRCLFSSLCLLSFR
ncbi:MAG: hypothetical protein LBB47_02305 [Spirochaetaceae bacterium]|nr:hypothetical protein [Spirochaetaceae bacterium]